MGRRRDDPQFIEIYRPANLEEILIIRSIMETTDMAFYIQNEHYFMTHPTLAIGDNEVRLMIQANRAEEAHELLARMGVIRINL